jgi:hypothetical protein
MGEQTGATKFVQHLLENKHGIGPMESIMHIIHITSKGKMMDIWKNSTYTERQKQTTKPTTS